MRELIQEIDKAAAAVRKVWDRTPQVGIVLGSGLGEFAEQLEVEATVDYQQIPNFARATALGHRGQLVCGRLEGKSVLAFQGRFHLYEGHSPQRATLPVRLLQRLGGDTLFVSNA